MCGRLTLHSDQKALAKAFKAEFSEKVTTVAHYNIPPGTSIPVVRHARSSGTGQSRLWESAFWGLIPTWQKTPRGHPNARAESLAEKPAFKDAWARQRCLIPADGFYEWDRRFQPRKPYYFTPSSAPFLTMGGLWTMRLNAQGVPTLTVAIITREARVPVDSIHDRMPLFIEPDDWDAWLAPERTPVLEHYLEAGTRVSLEQCPVSLAVNDARRDGPELVEPLQGPAGTQLQQDLFDS
jgi:putative SOS response-associated peptidase YedK